MKKQEKVAILMEEQQWLEDQINKCPKGYLNLKHINGGKYYYLQNREGKRVISTYIPQTTVKTVGRKIKMKKFYEQQLKEVKLELAAISSSVL